MADKQANLIIKLKDEVSGQLNNLKGSLSGLKTSFFAVTAAVTGIAAALYSSIKAYAENETAVNRLNVALKNQGVTSASVSTDLQQFAAQLSRQTTLTDEAILRSQALLVTFGLTGDRLKQTTKAAADLSTVLGVDLQTATMLLGKAAAGETGTLGRYGIKIDETIPKAERLGVVLEEIGKRAGGAAAAELNTAAGQMENLKNRINELQEDIGRLLLPAFKAIVTFAEHIVSSLETISASVKDMGIFRTMAAAWVEWIRLVGESVINLVGVIPGMGRAAQTMSAAFNSSLDSIQAKIAATKSEIESVGDVGGGGGGGRNLAQEADDAAAEEKRQKELDSIDQQTEAMLEKYTTREQALNELRQFYDEQQSQLLADQLTIQEQMELASLLRRQQQYGLTAKMKQTQDAALTQAQMQNATKLEEFKKKTEAEREKNFEQTLTRLAAMQNSHNSVMAGIGKAAALVQIGMDTARGAIAAYSSLAGIPIIGPALGAAAAAALIAYGVEQAAKVSGLQLAEGGIVMPRAGGVQATIGEGGSPEAVIPLDDPAATEQLAGIGATTIQISAGVIIADQISVEDFAKRIDEELYKLQRRGQSVSFGG